MLVEDDKSLREIYGVRLLAEGYDIVSAGDGEEALAMAIKERPGLIVSDVMMPKVSGYDMLDILRSTTETRNIKVIMMTALSSEEQRTRAESLGADRYLVKSQVGIEDVVRVVHEVLGDRQVATEVPAQQPAPSAPVRPVTPGIPSAPPRPVQSTTMPTPTVVKPPVTPTPQQAPAVPTQPAPTVPQIHQATETPKPASLKTRIIQPLGDPSVSPIDINELLDKELAKEAGLSDDMRPFVATAEQEKALVADQLQQFTSTVPEPTPVEAPEPTGMPFQPSVSSSPMPTPGISDPTMNNPAPIVSPAPVTTPTQPVSVLPAVPSIIPQPAVAIPTPPPPPAPVVPMQPVTSSEEPSAAAPSMPNAPLNPPTA